MRMHDYRQAQEARLYIISQLYMRGYSHREIRDEVMARLNLSSYSLRTVSKDVHRLLKEWKDARIENTDESVLLELSRIDKILKEAWDAWEKSKQDYDKRWDKQVGVPTENGNNAITTVKMEQSTESVNACGDPRFLEVIHKQLMERRKLLGLYKPEKKELTGADGKPLSQAPIVVEIIDRAEQVRPKEEE